MKLIDHMERESFDVNDALGIERMASQPQRLAAIQKLRAELDRLRAENAAMAKQLRTEIP